MTGTSILVEVSEIEVSKGHAVFTCDGIGSCLGLCAIDSIAGIGGMAHIMLPSADPGESEAKPGMFVDTAVPALIDAMLREGAELHRIVFAVAGGAQVLGASDTGNNWNMGALNSDAIRKAFEEQSLVCVSQDLGGSEGRTVTFCVSSGEIKVATIGGSEKLLCTVH